MLATVAVLAAAPASAGAADPIIAGAGDIACGPGDATMFDCEHGATSDLLVGLAPTAVVALGDLQYNLGRLVDFQEFYDPTWGRLKSVTYPVLGNHEYGSPNATGYFDYFNGVGAQNGPAGPRGSGYYSADIGSWHLVALNTNCARVPGGCGAGSPQESWLRADLAAHPSACTVAIAHHPLWDSNNGRDTEPAVRPLVQALYDAGVELYLVGHSHAYERFAPSRPDGTADAAYGVRQFIVGTGGRDLTGIGGAHPNSERRNGTTYGVIRFTLQPGSYDWRFDPIPGSSFTDSGSRACNGPPPPPAPPAPPPAPPAPPAVAPVPTAAVPAVTTVRVGRSGAPVRLASPLAVGTRGAARRVKVVSVALGRTRLVVRGTMPTRRTARRLRVTVTRRLRGARIRATAKAVAVARTRWRATVRLPRRARRLGLLHVTVRYLGSRNQPSQRVRFDVRRP
jgi:hypothetical protein